jgi:hypothetical protein
VQGNFQHFYSNSKSFAQRQMQPPVANVSLTTTTSTSEAGKYLQTSLNLTGLSFSNFEPRMMSIF